jgi:hypothetical protein
MDCPAPRTTHLDWSSLLPSFVKLKAGSQDFPTPETAYSLTQSSIRALHLLETRTAVAFLQQELWSGGKSRFELLRSGSVSPQTKGRTKIRTLYSLQYKPDLKQSLGCRVAVKEVAVITVRDYMCDFPHSAPNQKHTVALSARLLRLFVTRPHLEKIGPSNFQLVNDAMQQPLRKLAMGVYRYRGCLTALRN